MVRAAGFEPEIETSKFKDSAAADTAIGTLSAKDSEELAEVILIWSRLPAPLRAAVMALVRSQQGTA